MSSIYLRLLIFLLEILTPACASPSPAFLMMYTAYKLNKQGDNIHLWHTPFPIWNQSVIPCPVLFVAYWLAYRFLKRQVRWSGIPISWIFQFVVIHTVKGFGIVNKVEPYINMNQQQIYIYVPSLLKLPPTSYPVPPLEALTEHQVELSGSHSNFPLAVYFTCGNVYVLNTFLFNVFVLMYYFKYFKHWIKKISKSQNKKVIFYICLHFKIICMIHLMFIHLCIYHQEIWRFEIHCTFCRSFM